MTETRIDELLDKADSKFALVIGAAKRTRQITDFLNSKTPGEIIGKNNAPPPVTDIMTKKPLMIAIDEIADGNIAISYTEPAAEVEIASEAEEPAPEEESPETTNDEGEPQ